MTKVHGGLWNFGAKTVQAEKGCINELLQPSTIILVFIVVLVMHSFPYNPTNGSEVFVTDISKDCCSMRRY